MIVLDTNVLSELMRAAPDTGVIDWLAAQPAPSLFTTAICEAEIHYGVAVLPASKRKRALALAATGLFDDFEDRILAFDSNAARSFGEIAAARRRSGKPISQSDAQIAAIVRSLGARLATRSLHDFGGCGVALIDPWKRN